MIRLIIAYTLLGSFVFTVIATTFSLVGWVKFADHRQQSLLFKSLIAQLVVIGVGFFANLLKFNPTQVESAVADSEIAKRKATFEETLKEAVMEFKAGEISKAYGTVNSLYRSPELENYFPIRDLFVISGDIAKSRKFWKEAVESYGPALKLDSDNVSVLSNLGYAYRMMSNYEEAEKLYDRALSHDGQNWESLNGYFNCLRRYAAFLQGKYPKISASKFERASEVADQMRTVAETPTEKRISDIAKASLYWEWKQYDVAINLYRKLLEKYPEEQRFKEDLAAILVETKRYNEALDLFSILYQKEKGAGNVTWFVASGFAEAAAKAHSPSETLQSALTAGLTAITLDDSDPFTRYAVALVYKEQGESNNALLHLKEAIALEERRSTNIHTYDYDRHQMYLKLEAEWASTN